MLRFAHSSQPHLTLLSLKEEYYQSLTAPPDGMWLTFKDHADQYEIYLGDRLSGYFCLDKKHGLLNFFIRDNILSHASEIFEKILSDHKVKSAVVETSNPLFLAKSMDHAKKVETHSLLFQDFEKISISIPMSIEDAEFRPATPGDMEGLLAFNQRHSDADPKWLEEYLHELINRGEIHLLEASENIIGSCEVRKNKANADFADVGMIVGEDHRRKGLGAYLLASAKAICYRYNLTPICSCEISNVSSRSAIEKVGFISKHRILKVRF